MRVTAFSFADLLVLALQTSWRLWNSSFPKATAKHLDVFCDGPLLQVEYLHVGESVLAILSHRDEHTGTWRIALTRLPYTVFDALVEGRANGWLRRWFPIDGQIHPRMDVQKWAAGVEDDHYEAALNMFRKQKSWKLEARCRWFVKGTPETSSAIRTSQRRAGAESTRQADDKLLRRRLREQTDSAMLARPERKRI